jgi:hypothetical protein
MYSSSSLCLLHALPSMAICIFMKEFSVYDIHVHLWTKHIRDFNKYLAELYFLEYNTVYSVKISWRFGGTCHLHTQG